MSHLVFYKTPEWSKKKKLSQSACTLKLKLTEGEKLINKDMYLPSTMRGTVMVKQTILHGNGETDIIMITWRKNNNVSVNAVLATRIAIPMSCLQLLSLYTRQNLIPFHPLSLIPTIIKLLWYFSTSTIMFHEYWSQFYLGKTIKSTSKYNTLS